MSGRSDQGVTQFHPVGFRIGMKIVAGLLADFSRERHRLQDKEQIVDSTLLTSSNAGVNFRHRNRRPGQVRLRNQFRNQLGKRMVASEPTYDHIGIEQNLSQAPASL